MKTQWFLVLFALLLCAGLAFTACGDDDDDDDSGDDDDDDDSGDDDDDDSGDDDDDDNATGDTWTDSSSGLTWQVTPPNYSLNWEDAKAYCQDLSLSGGGWRLPTISELRSLIRGCDLTITGGSCGVTDGCTYNDCWNDACNGCVYLGGPGEGGAYWPDGMSGEISWYWSSSPVAGSGYAWGVSFYYGDVYDIYDYNYFARCVR